MCNIFRTEPVKTNIKEPEPYTYTKEDMGKDRIIKLIKTAYKSARVWKTRDNDVGYTNGWNDCIKEQKKLEKKFLEHIKSL